MILSVTKIKKILFNNLEKMDYITEQMEIYGEREEEDIAADYSLHNI